MALPAWCAPVPRRHSSPPDSYAAPGKAPSPTTRMTLDARGPASPIASAACPPFLRATWPRSPPLYRRTRARPSARAKRRGGQSGQRGAPGRSSTPRARAHLCLLPSMSRRPWPLPPSLKGRVAQGGARVTVGVRGTGLQQRRRPRPMRHAWGLPGALQAGGRAADTDGGGRRSTATASPVSPPPGGPSSAASGCGADAPTLSRGCVARKGEVG